MAGSRTAQAVQLRLGLTLSIMFNSTFKGLLFAVAVALTGLTADAQTNEAGFIPLFDGKTLKGWHVSGKTGHSRTSKNQTGGRWGVEDGAIVGSQAFRLSGTMRGMQNSTRPCEPERPSASKAALIR